MVCICLMASSLVMKSIYMSNNSTMKFQFSIYFFATLFSSLSTAQIFFSEYAEGSSYNKYLEIYNYSPETINLNEYAFPSCSNGCDVDGEWDYMNYFPDGASIAPGDVYVITHPNASDPESQYYSEEIAIYSDHEFSYLSNGDDVFALIHVDSGVVFDVIGAMGPDPGDGWDVAGVTNATKDHTLVRKSSVSSGNLGDWTSSAGVDVSDSEWIVFDNETWDNLGFHIYENNGSDDILGCMCEDASNYMSSATIDDGSCVIDGGCSDPDALNYSGDACGVVTFINEDCEYETVDISGCYAEDMACNYFDFNYQITGGNMTINVPLIALEENDIIGAFYVNQDGFLVCGGSGVFEGEQMAIAVWADDPSTNTIDGFDVGDTFIFLILRNGVVFETTSIMNTQAPFVGTFLMNGFGQVTSLSIDDPFLQDCVYPPLGYDCDGNSISIEEDSLVGRYVVETIDLLGRNVSSNSIQALKMIIYNDGSVEKKYYLNH